jgi:hypothetical protein
MTGLEAETKWDRWRAAAHDRNWQILAAIAGAGLAAAVVSSDVLAAEYTDQASILGARQEHSRPVCRIDSELPSSAGYARAVIEKKLEVKQWHHPIFVMNVVCDPPLGEAKLEPGIRIAEIGTYEGDEFLRCVLMPSGGLAPDKIQAYCLERGREA